MNTRIFFLDKNGPDYVLSPIQFFHLTDILNGERVGLYCNSYKLWNALILCFGVAVNCKFKIFQIKQDGKGEMIH